MPGFTPEECVACERCGAFIPHVLVKFHQCKGTDVTKRPANVPLETWLNTEKIRASIESTVAGFDKSFHDFRNALESDDTPTNPRVILIDVPQKSLHMNSFLYGALFGGVVGTILWFLVMK
jgi:hypothetical protein